MKHHCWHCSFLSILTIIPVTFVSVFITVPFFSVKVCHHPNTLHHNKTNQAYCKTLRNQKYYLTLCLHLSTTPYAPGQEEMERKMQTLNKKWDSDVVLKFWHLNYALTSKPQTNRFMKKKYSRWEPPEKQPLIGEAEACILALPHTTHTHSYTFHK